MSDQHNPFLEHVTRDYGGDEFARAEVALANRNSGLALELMCHDITPMGMHYLLTHFDVPAINPDTYRLNIAGQVGQALSLTLDDIKAREQVTLAVTLECAGNGRSGHLKRNISMPWHHEAVGTAEWTGTPLADVLQEAGLEDDAVEIAFIGADRGFDHAVEHDFGRGLTVEQARNRDILLVHEMNGMPLLPQHGYPLRLIVPGWYGMASVKWLARIEVLDHEYDGFQQMQTYRYRQTRDEVGVPVREIRVRSLMIPPGIPDWYSRERLVDAGPVEISGRAWSGNGVPIERVEFSEDGKNWQVAQLGKRTGKYGWTGWDTQWDAQPGTYALACRATDANGTVQPMDPPWDAAGFGNNAVQRVKVTVR